MSRDRILLLSQKIRHRNRNEQSGRVVYEADDDEKKPLFFDLVILLPHTTTALPYCREPKAKKGVLELGFLVLRKEEDLCLLVKRYIGLYRT